MSGMKYQIGGRTVSQHEFMKNIKDSVLNLADQGVRERVLSVRCPVHGQGPTNLKGSRSSSKMGWEYNACCDRLRKAVEGAFK